MMGRWQSGAPLALCPMHDDPELGADPKRNNDFLFQGRRSAGLENPSRLAHSTYESTRLRHQRLHALPSHDPARHQLRPPASARSHRGRRRRTRVGVRLHRGEFGAAIRVRPAGVGQQRAVLSWPCRRTRTQSRARTTEADRSPSRNSRSADGYRVCRLSSSPGEASISSRPACARCAGWPISTPDEEDVDLTRPGPPKIRHGMVDARAG